MPKRDRSAMERAHDEILRRITSLELRPGQTLDDGEISARLGLSRTPVREALFRLSSEGLVRVGPRGGFQVSTIDLLGVRSLFEAQQVLVRAVAHLLVARASDADLDALERQAAAVDTAIEGGDPAAIADANTELHILEAHLTGNEHLATLAARIHRENQRLAFLSFGGEDRGRADLAELHGLPSRQHAAFLAALRARDASLAERVAADHVDVFRLRVAALLERDDSATVDLSGLVQDPPATADGDGRASA